MLYSKIKTIKVWLLKFIELHLFISVLSLPILIYWGLPFSLASIIGNLIFAPFLALFLFISSLLFFTEILTIPNQPLVFLIEKIAVIWSCCLSFAQKKWLIGFAKPPLLFLFLMPIPATIIVASRLLSAMTRIILLLALILTSYIFCSIIFVKKETIFFIDCGSQKISALKHNNQIVLFSTNPLARLKSPAQWVDYTLIPALVKNRGTTDIDHLILTMPGQKIFEIVTIMLSKVSIKNIYLIVWEGSLTPKAWHHYFKMKETAKTCGCAIHRIGTKETLINLSMNAQLSLKPIDTIKKQTFSVSKITINYSIDNKTTLLL